MIYYIHFKDRSLWKTSKDLQEAKKEAKRIKGTVSTLKKNRYTYVSDYKVVEQLPF